MVFENPRAAYEIMGILRLCASMNVGLRIVNGREYEIRRAMKIIGGIAGGVRLKTYPDLDEALRNVYPLGLVLAAFLMNMT